MFTPFILSYFTLDKDTSSNIKSLSLTFAFYIHSTIRAVTTTTMTSKEKIMLLSMIRISNRN
ncbi:MAG: hypothetical protein CMN96_03985 [Synechococcus sp. MED850]|nr:hypothetical protein [Synechococcus sp. MED850]OUW98418.1 MAG: hypothetical protein CBD89_02710 [Cyanobacteria bacterium TMED229]